MTLPSSEAAPRNQEVAKTVITYTVIHPTSLDPSRMKPEHVAYHLTDGEFIGHRTGLETTVLADDEVEPALKALGDDGTAFRLENRSRFDITAADMLH